MGAELAECGKKWVYFSLFNNHHHKRQMFALFVRIFFTILVQHTKYNAQTYKIRKPDLNASTVLARTGKKRKAGIKSLAGTKL